ncbi:MAG: hypothetical protein E6I79_09060 [Chloroflexi bacterium]|nr:MAG: hypothetical protein E6I79_09060 [Chloroflexota bacterium]
MSSIICFTSTFGDHACHPEHSEGSGSTDTEILRCAQDDSLGFCQPERSEGSLVHSSSKPASRGLADFWGITS